MCQIESKFFALKSETYMKWEEAPPPVSQRYARLLWAVNQVRV